MNNQNVQISNKTETQNNMVHNEPVGEKIKAVIFHKKFLILGIVVIILLPITLYFAVTTKNDNHAISRDAEQEYQAGNYDSAIKIYSNALKKDKSNPELLAGVIKTIAAKGNDTGQENKSFAIAKPYIDTSLQEAPNNIDVLQSVGYAYETAGNYAEALTYYDKAVKLDSTSASALFHYGHVLQFLNRQDEANAAYAKSYTLDKNQPQLLMIQANASMQQGNAQRAYDLFKQAATIPTIASTTRAEALTGASIVRGSQDNFKYIKDALSLSTQAVAADPNFSPALAIQGYNLYLTDPTTDQGFVYMKKAITANPRIAKNYYMLGLFYRASSDYTNAINYLKDAIAKVDEDNTLLSSLDKNQSKSLYLYQLAKTYSTAKISANTLPLLQQAISLNPSVKSQIQKDMIINNTFNELQGNQDFINLVKG